MISILLLRAQPPARSLAYKIQVPVYVTIGLSVYQSTGYLVCKHIQSHLATDAEAPVDDHATMRFYCVPAMITLIYMYTRAQYRHRGLSSSTEW